MPVLIVLLILLASLLAAVVRTLALPRKQTDYTPSADGERIARYAEKLSRMVACETVSVRNHPDPEKFRGFHALLKTLFPQTFAACDFRDFDGSMLLHWRGKSPENPILLMSHMDVVEASGDWKYPPFSGEIAAGKVWGRGAADTKCSLMAILQAVEELIAEGFVPGADVYIASSCTEEIGGDGAPKIAAWLKEQGVHLALLCDEGGSIVQNPIGGVSGHFAAIGVFEKGYGDVRFVARSSGGHASAPGKNTPIPRLARFITAVEKRSPFTARFSPAVKDMFQRIAPYAGPFSLRLLLHNLWLFGPLMIGLLPRISPQAAAMLQTTIAFTMQSGSQGYNVLPQEASVCANLRFIPHQSASESLALLEKMAARYGLEMETLYRGEPSRPLNLSGPAFAAVEEAIRQVFPGVCPMPYVVTGGTDARFYGDVCESCVRFSPVLYTPEQLQGMHGLNESINADCLPAAVDWYKAIINAR